MNILMGFGNMKTVLPSVDVPKVLEWGTEYYKDLINTDSIWQVCNWCRMYAKNSPDKDTKNVLCRLNVGVYQLAYVNSMVANGKAPASEWSEAIVSCMVHMIGSIENVGVDCAREIAKEIGASTFSKLSYKLQSLYTRRIIDAHYELLATIPSIVQQVYYFEMGRKNRYSQDKLTRAFLKFVTNSIVLNECGWDSLPIEQGVALVMDKLSNVELNRH